MAGWSWLIWGRFGRNLRAGTRAEADAWTFIAATFYFFDLVYLGSAR